MRQNCSLGDTQRAVCSCMTCFGAIYVHFRWRSGRWCEASTFLSSSLLLTFQRSDGEPEKHQDKGQPCQCHLVISCKGRSRHRAVNPVPSLLCVPSDRHSAPSSALSFMPFFVDVVVVARKEKEKKTYWPSCKDEAARDSSFKAKIFFFFFCEKPPKFCYLEPI